MGKKLDKFFLLMWKNFLIQWRHPMQTVIEILAPVLFTSLLVIVRSLVDPELHEALHFQPFELNKIPVMANLTPPIAETITIAWSPSNSVLNGIMNDAVESIIISNNTSIRHSSFKNSEELNKFLGNEFNLITTLVGVQFDDTLAEATELPPKIDIIFRFPGELRSAVRGSNATSGFEQMTWKTNLMFAVYQISGPRDRSLNTGAVPSYYEEGFLKIQQELSLSIINYFKKSVQNKAFDRESINIMMQRYPYPAWIDDILLKALQSFVGLIIMLSFVYTCVSTVRIITIEKEKQLKESMKIMGLPNWLHWLAWFLKTFVMLLITITLVVIILKAKWYRNTDYTVFTKSNPLVIYLFLTFYVCATITYCFAISVFFSKANTAAAISGMAWFLSYFPYSFLQDRYDYLNLSQKLATSLCSNSAMAFGFQLMLMFEGTGEGLQWSNVWKSTGPDDTLTLGHLMIMMSIDTVLYLLFALYVEAVFPGDYGVPKPWYFIFTSSFWCGPPKYIGVTDCVETPLENEFYEREPTDLDIGLKIQNLNKVYGKKTAVNDMSLNMYKDQITVLLGHNGAGKTTTMSMLTGMIPPTNGSAIISGYDIRTDMPKVRDSLGLCPQHNILFDELTVKEHLQFYGQLKGLSKKKIGEEVDKYIRLLEFESKANAMSSTLSGGMKRKLSVGVALCGDSSVVMLDEPTAGIDPAARRALWDLLQTQKKGRTILLTTHFMDEADLLGDRIAIMSGGKLKCCGSSFFLKKKYGAGYHLILDKKLTCNTDRVTTLLQKHLPNIHIESNVGSELSYLLSENQSSVFEEMLSDLENNSEELGVLSYGISLTTLEEVFMKVGAEHHEDDREPKNVAKLSVVNGKTEVNGYSNGTLDVTDENDKISDIEFHPYIDNNSNNNKSNGDTVKSNHHRIINMEPIMLTGFSLWRNQIVAMFMKRGLSILRSWLLLVIQVCIPVLFIALAIAVVRSVNRFSDLPKLKVELKSYGNPVTAVSNNPGNAFASSFINIAKTDNANVIEWGSANFSSKILEETEKNVVAVRLKHICGATFNESDSKNDITAWFNNEPYHSPPVALQLITNSILQTEVSPEHYIQIYNHPLPFTLNTKFKRLAQGYNMGFQIAFNIGFSMAFVSSFYVMFYIKERASKSKHLQFVSGIDVLAFWGPSFICDLLTFIFTSLCIIITLLIFQEDGFTKVEELGRVFSVLLYFGFSMLPLMYLSSYCFDIPSSGYTKMSLINIFTGVAGFLIVQVLSAPNLELEHVADILHWIFLLIPHYSLSTGIRDINMIYATHKLCDTMLDSCINFKIPNYARLSPAQCKIQLCKAQPQCCETTTDYYAWEAPGIGRNVVFSCCVGVLLISILLVVEYRVVENILYKINQNRITKPISNDSNEDDDVKQEKKLVKLINKEELKNYSIVMRDVTKYYNKFLAVNNISLAVNKYECFGLLGVNGAGKTTTFKMMTGDIRLSSGEAWLNGYNVKSDMKKINQFIGYCPQFDALLDDLTCKETLVMFGLIRGVLMSESKVLAEKLSKEFDFHQHLNKKVKELSGGNKRKLSTAITLIGNTVVLYLDEPTTGMDPATKRYLWNALCKVRDNGKCIVLTSHSMEECEALCTRLAIMVNGQFKCIGSTQHLKSKFSEGYTLTVKIRKQNNNTTEVQNFDLDPIEKFVKDSFNGAITREKHQEMITFYISDKTLPWSKMFGIMERGKQELHIEDYSLGQCSLEQVFLSFTKYQREGQ